MRKEFLGIWNLKAEEEGTALDSFHLHMSRGDFVELLGTEGCGKEDLAEFFAGKLRIGEGYVKIGNVRYYPGETLSGGEIQCLDRNPTVAGSLTVAENILLLSGKGRRRGIIRRKELEAHANFLLSEFGMRFQEGLSVDRLTEGEKRVIELVRATESGVSLLVINNIFESLGQDEILLIGKCLSKLKERGMTILVLGGRFPLFRELDDRVVVMRSGRNVRTFFRGNFDRNEFVKWVFGAPEPARIREEAVRRAEPDESVKREAETEECVLKVRGLDGNTFTSFSCDIRKGEIVGIYDMNNRQNRELVRMLSGEASLPEGAVFLSGRPYAPKSLGEAIHLGCAWIPGNIGECSVVDRMNYRENLTLAVLKKISAFGVFVNKRMGNFLEAEYGKELEASETEKKSAYLLGTTDRMRVVFQRILLANPKILLAEDILSDMNVRMLKVQTGFFTRLTKTGCAVMLSSQNLMVLRQVCDRIIVMSDRENDKQEGYLELSPLTSKNSPPFRNLN